MNKIRSTILLLLLATYGFAGVPTWTVNPSDYNYSMQVTCKLNQSCVDLANSNNLVGAFVGGQCRGYVASNITVGADYLALLVIHSNTLVGEKVNFQIYNSVDDTVLNVLDSIFL
jgi:hypothetical protein